MNFIKKLMKLFDQEGLSYQDMMRINSAKEKPFPEHPRYLTYSETENLMKTLKWIVENDPHPENVKMQIKSDYDKIMKAWNPNYEPRVK